MNRSRPRPREDDPASDNMGSQTVLLMMILGLFSVPVSAEEDLRSLVEALGAQVKQLSSRVNELEYKLAQEQEARRRAEAILAAPHAPARASAIPAVSEPALATEDPEPGVVDASVNETEAVTVGDGSAWYKIPGTETALALGGYVKLDTLYNSVSAGPDQTADQFLIPGAIPVGSARNGEHGQVTFTARESRLWLNSFTPSDWGDLSAYLEIDFYGQNDIDERTTNSHTPRLRHAYGTFGNLLAGQTWSTFMNVAALPELNDFGGPVGEVIIRQPQIRWTQPLSVVEGPLDFQVALESPETTLTLPDGNRLVPDDDRSPDLVARLNYSPDWGSLSVAGLARQIRVSNQGSSQAWGGAFSLAGKVRISGLDNFRFMLNYGNALGRYISYNLFNDGVLDPAGKIDLLNVYSGFLSLQHWWNPDWRSTIAYGFAQADYPGVPIQPVSRQAQSVHVNLLWSPLLQTTIGLEYIYALRRLTNGMEGDLQRVQFSTRFNF